MSAVEPLPVIATTIAPTAAGAKPRGVGGGFSALVDAAANPGQGADRRAATAAGPDTVPASPDPADAALAAVAAAPGQPQPPPFAALLAPPPGEAAEPVPETGAAATDEAAGAAPVSALAAPVLAAAAPAGTRDAEDAGAGASRGSLVSAFAGSLDPSARGEAGPGAPAWAGRTAEGEEPAPTPGARVAAFVAELKAQGAQPPATETAPAPTEDAAAVAAEGEETSPAASSPQLLKSARAASTASLDRAATPVPAPAAPSTAAESGVEPGDDADRGPLFALTKSTPGRERSGGPAAAALEATAAAAARREAAAAPTAPVVEAEDAEILAAAPVETTVNAARTGAQGTGAASAHLPVAHAAAGSAEALAQVGAQMLRRLDGRAVRFDMELHPADLGRVSVSLEIDRDGRVSAAMAFDNAQTAADMRARSDELRRMLEQAGFTLSDDAFSFTEREAREGGRGPGEETRQAGRAFAESADLVETADRDWRLERRIRAGGVDVRI